MLDQHISKALFSLFSLLFSISIGSEYPNNSDNLDTLPLNLCPNEQTAQSNTPLIKNNLPRDKRSFVLSFLPYATAGVGTMTTVILGVRYPKPLFFTGAGIWTGLTFYALYHASNFRNSSQKEKE